MLRRLSRISSLLFPISAQAAEETGFQLRDSFLRVDDERFEFFELKRDKAFRIGERLFARVIAGNKCRFGRVTSIK